VGALHSAYHLNRLRRRLFLPPADLYELKKVKLAALLRYCYERIPYYQEKFRQISARPEDFRRPEDLVYFPILEKETLRDRASEFLDPLVDQNRLLRYRSSGSTGIPLELFYHPSERLRMGFTVTRELFYNGFRPWQRLVNITEPRHSSSKNRWYHRLGFMDEKFLSVYSQSRLTLKALRLIRPQALIGFPSVLMVIGRNMYEDRGKILTPKLLFTLAEVLDREDRKILQQQWGVEPIDLYGANEVGHIAFQCPRREDYHVNVDSIHLEIMSGNNAVGMGERGEVVVTNLDLRVMPILRYRVGDVVQRLEGHCACGCAFPVIGSIAGRSDGFIVAADGKIFSALEISLLLKPIRDINQFRILQKERHKIIVEWVPRDSNSQTQAQIKQILENRLGRNMEILLQRVNHIPPERSGKIRTVISHLPNPFWEKT
jgi:phenylacetate-CoA ligase